MNGGVVPFSGASEPLKGRVISPDEPVQGQGPDAAQRHQVYEAFLDPFQGGIPYRHEVGYKTPVEVGRRILAGVPVLFDVGEFTPTSSGRKAGRGVRVIAGKLACIGNGVPATSEASNPDTRITELPATAFVRMPGPWSRTIAKLRQDQTPLIGVGLQYEDPDAQRRMQEWL